MTKSVRLLAGLPGCGKTTYLNELQQDGWATFDDFKAGAADDSPEFRKSRHFVDLLAELRAGFRCVVADIDFCRTESRTEAESILLAEVPGLEISWVYFAHDKRACEANIRHRKRGSLEADLTELHKYSRIYSIPKGADVRPVPKGECNSRRT